MLEGAEFTVYRDAITGEFALDDDDVKIKDESTNQKLTIYTYTDEDNVVHEYVRREETPGEKKYYTFTKGNNGTYSFQLADPQPTETDLKVKRGDVASNVVYTDIHGTADIEFLEPGKYYVKETKEPTGYTADPTIYAFVVTEDLKVVTLENPDVDHDTKWWQMKYDMGFGPDTTAAVNWDKDNNILTVDNVPLTANVLVRKIWEDNDDQDGVRPKDYVEDQTTHNMVPNPDTPVVILQWTTAAHTATGLPVYINASGTKYVRKTADNKYYKVVREDEPGEFKDEVADPQPENVTENSETCRKRKVYVDSNDNKKYVIVGGIYHEVTSVDKIGEIESNEATPQPNEEDLSLVMDEGEDWKDMKVGRERRSECRYHGGFGELCRRSGAYRPA